MNNHITLSTIRERLEEQNMMYRTYQLPGGYEILVMEKSGRIFGPYKDDQDEGIFWVNKAYSNKKEFEAFLNDPNEWCFGGDRLWITPEFPFFNTERADFFNSYVVQKGIDPADYTMLTDQYGNLMLYSELHGEIFESAYKHKEVYLEKTIRRNENPLRNLENYAEYMEDVTYTGFEQEVILRDTTPEVPIEMEIWDLTQINPGGEIIVPYTDGYGFVDYYAPTGDDIVSDKDSYISVNINSKVDHKLGFYSATTTGRAAYLTSLDDGNFCLFVKNYYNDPAGYSVGEPWDQPGKSGCSLYLYIDGGGLGGFTEFENVGRAIGGSTGRRYTMDNTNFWFYYGSKSSLEKIACVLLGIHKACKISTGPLADAEIFDRSIG